MFVINSTVQTVHWNCLKIVSFGSPDSKVCPICPLDSVIHKGSWLGQASLQRRKCQVSTNLWVNSLLSTCPWEARENQGPVQAITTVVDLGEGPAHCPLTFKSTLRPEGGKVFFLRPPPSSLSEGLDPPLQKVVCVFCNKVGLHCIVYKYSFLQGIMWVRDSRALSEGPVT